MQTPPPGFRPPSQLPCGGRSSTDSAPSPPLGQACSRDARPNFIGNTRLPAPSNPTPATVARPSTMPPFPWGVPLDLSTGGRVGTCDRNTQTDIVLGMASLPHLPEPGQRERRVPHKQGRVGCVMQRHRPASGPYDAVLRPDGRVPTLATSARVPPFQREPMNLVVPPAAAPIAASAPEMARSLADLEMMYDALSPLRGRNERSPWLW